MRGLRQRRMCRQVNESVSAKGVTVEIWAGLAGPPKLPRGIVERINRAVQNVLSDQALREARTQTGDVLAPPASAASFRDFVSEEERRYRGLAAAGVGIRRIHSSRRFSEPGAP